MSSKWEDNEEIKIFREYLQIPSVHPNIDYEPCVEFLKRQADSLGLPVTVYHPCNKENPIVVLTWKGSDPDLSSIILNSHMDVVPVFEKNWTHPPFSAHMDADGRIFARGSQDMKCVGVQYLAAIRALQRDGIQQLKRTVHIMFVPDEEVGGVLGVRQFVLTDEFKALNIGFSLDEGIASPSDVYSVFYGERSLWHIELICNGTSGHGSLLLKNTPGEKINYLINKFMEFRAHEVQKLENNPELTIGDVTTVNITMLRGGLQNNVVPPSLSVYIDIRIATDVSHTELDAQIRRWCKEAGDGVELVYEMKEPKILPTKIDDSNIFWNAFRSTIVDDLKLKISKQIFTGATDSRFIREVGIPAIGFSPMIDTPILLHDNDEFLLADTYLNGIQIYKALIKKIGNI